MSTDYKNNAGRKKDSRADRPRPTKVVRGAVKFKKKSEASKLKDVFISEDANNVGSYIFMDVIVPAVKKAIVDVVTDGVNMIFFGHTRRPGSTNAHYVNYSGISKKDDRGAPYIGAAPTRSRYSYEDIVLESRAEADEVIDQLNALIEMYGDASVGDLYDLVGRTGNYTDNRYGWKNLRNARAVRVQNGYLLELPKVIPLN